MWTCWETQETSLTNVAADYRRGKRQRDACLHTESTVRTSGGQHKLPLVYAAGVSFGFLPFVRSECLVFDLQETSLEFHLLLQCTVGNEGANCFVKSKPKEIFAVPDIASRGSARAT